MRLDGYIGIPYRDNGRGVDGCDCYGLVLLIYREVLGIALPTYEGMYSCEDPSAARAIQRLRAQWWREIGEADADWLDAMILRVQEDPGHIALYVGEGQMLHCSRIRGESCIERLDDRFWNWRDKIEGYFRCLQR